MFDVRVSVGGGVSSFGLGVLLAHAGIGTGATVSFAIAVGFAFLFLIQKTGMDPKGILVLTTVCVIAWFVLLKIFCPEVLSDISAYIGKQIDDFFTGIKNSIRRFFEGIWSWIVEKGTPVWKWLEKWWWAALAVCAIIIWSPFAINSWMYRDRRY